MTNDGVAKDDVKVPEGDLGKDIQAGFDEGKDLLVTIISAMNEEQVCLVPSSTYTYSFMVTWCNNRPSPLRRPQKAPLNDSSEFFVLGAPERRLLTLN